MSNKKELQYLRREARKKAEGLMKSFEEHLRPKPWYVPAFIWRAGARIFIKL